LVVNLKNNNRCYWDAYLLFSVHQEITNKQAPRRRKTGSPLTKLPTIKHKDAIVAMMDLFMA